jgi:Protein of unknown function (DUF2950)
MKSISTFLRNIKPYGRVGPAAALLAFAMTSAASAQQTFSTAEAAASALAGAAKAGDRAAVLTVLGKSAGDIVSSGDPVADAEARQKFLTAYDAKHQITMDGDSKAIMVIGPEDYPFPIPLVRKDGKWEFDTATGRKEILYRRIGRNELDTIQSCLAYVDAQSEYADMMRSGELAPYAQRFVSSPGKKDGLYWPSATGEPPSPLGDLVAGATREGYEVNGSGAPYHGYHFKILKRQGPSATGGAHDYVVNGKMIGGFALVAYPADYGNSGVMTFMVNHDGVVFEKDLGEETEKIAPRITSFNPDHTWKKVADTEPVK